MKRALAPLPSPNANPNMTGIQDPVVHEAMRAVLRQLNATTRFVRSTVTPANLPPPTGVNALSVSAVGGTFIVNFRADQSGPFIKVYRVYRAVAGTRSAPTDPGPDTATCIATISPNSAEDGGLYRYPDRNFTIQQLDPANPTRFKYWVTSVDDRDIEGPFVEASGNPIECLTNGPGDQSPQQKFVPLNKLYQSLPWINNGGASTNVGKISAIAASTNAAPIVLTVAAGHGIAVGDLLCVDNHAVNTNANGWWIVQAVAVNAITLQGSVGNGVGGATGNVMPVNGGFGSTFPQMKNAVVAGGVLVPDYVNGMIGGPRSTQLVVQTPWYQPATNAAANSVVVVAGTNVFSIAESAALAHNDLVQEIGTRRFNGSMRVSFSVYAQFGVLPTAGTINLVAEGTDGSFTFSTSWTQAQFTAATWQRLCFNFQLPAPPLSANRIRFKIQYFGNGGANPLWIGKPMVNVGDVAACFTELQDYGDYYTHNLSDSTVDAWGRPVTTLITRDSSAPYV